MSMSGLFHRFEVSETPTGISGTKGSYGNKNIKSPLFEVKKSLETEVI